jgi:hypothetical protein
VKKKDGRSRPRTAKQRAASRRNAFRTGQYARSVTKQQVSDARLAKLDKTLPQVVRAIRDALEGDSSAWRVIQASGLAALALNFQKAQAEIAAHGIVIEESVIAGDEVVGTRRVLSPAFEVIHKLSERLGFSARDQLLTPQSKSETAGDALAAVRARREMELLGFHQRQRARFAEVLEPKRIAAKTEER